MSADEGKASVLEWLSTFPTLLLSPGLPRYTQVQMTDHRSRRASLYVPCPLHGADVLAVDKWGSYRQDHSDDKHCCECQGRCQSEHLAMARPQKRDPHHS